MYVSIVKIRAVSCQQPKLWFRGHMKSLFLLPYSLQYVQFYWQFLPEMLSFTLSRQTRAIL